MDSSDFPPPRKLPRRELQRPRPPPRVQEDSRKIKKPPVMAGPPPPPPSQLPGQARQPVVIYSLPPRVIHTNRSDFKDLVQRLTGLPAPKDDAATASSRLPRPVDQFLHQDAAVSPAAWLASVERTAESRGSKRPRRDNGDDGDVTMLEGIDMTMDRNERTGMVPGILSPGPSSLQPIPATLFSPPSDQNPNPLSFFQELSDPAAPYSNKNPNFSDLSGLLQSPQAPFFSPQLDDHTLTNIYGPFQQFFWPVESFFVNLRNSLRSFSVTLTW